jgi:hypothetical protein
MVQELPQPVRRVPWTVNLAALLLVVAAALTAALSSIYIVDTLHYGTIVKGVVRDTGNGADQVPEYISDNHIGDIAVVAVCALSALVLILVALWARRHNGGRIVACIVVIADALCCGLGMGFLDILPSDYQSGDAFADEVSRRQDLALPVWTEPELKITAIALPLCAFGVLLLLLNARSNRYYRRPAPPVPAMAYPVAAYPGYPPAPYPYASPYPPTGAYGPVTYPPTGPYPPTAVPPTANPPLAQPPASYPPQEYPPSAS